MKIRNIDLGDKPVLLAPMEDVTDPAFRLLCKEFGADMVYTEFVSSDALIRSVGKTMLKLNISDAERPVAIQIYGKDTDTMVEAARIVEQANPDILDLNFGCPVKRVAGKGLTRLEVADLIKYRLLAGKLLRDPTVTVEYANMYYYVMGEVGNPGKHEIEHDQITLLEALSEAGDLTIQGRRDNILVLRTVNGEQTPYRVDITQTEKLYGSPAFYLQQNDLIYVEPNTMRVNQSQLNANTLRTPGFWFSTTSFVLSLILLLTR